jgi:hypothetical protein
MTNRLRIFLLSCVAIIFASALTFNDARGQAHSKKPCADNLASCPITGCEEEGTEHALTNKLKRTIPAAGITASSVR